MVPRNREEGSFSTEVRISSGSCCPGRAFRTADMAAAKDSGER